MAKYIDIVTGILESGKTTLITDLIENEFLTEYNRIILLTCEDGFTEYDEDFLRENNIKNIMIEEESELTDEFINKIIKHYRPDYILVEYNGMWDISKILGLKVPFEYIYRKVVFVSEATQFRNYLGNLTTVVQPQILNSNAVILNRHEELKEGTKKDITRDIKNINPKIKVSFLEEYESDEVINTWLYKADESEDSSSSSVKMNVKAGIFLGICVYMFYVLQNDTMYQYCESIATVFLGIFIQAVPFLLLGAFISSAIQIFASTQWITNKIAKGGWKSFILSSVGGIFLPICDCGTVPIVSGLLKKGAPLPQTITFWLASSAVSPIVILSTYFAFPQYPYIVLVRITSGIFIALIVGIILKIKKVETKSVLKHNIKSVNVGKDMLDLKYSGKKGKIEAVLEGTRIEFFRVLEFVIIAALVSAFFQQILPDVMQNFIGDNIPVQFIVMIIASLFISTCSTANAFIGSSLINNFALAPIISFVVMGPMLDIKNMIMLSEVLKKSFLVFLGLCVIFIGFITFGILAFFI